MKLQFKLFSLEIRLLNFWCWLSQKMCQVKGTNSYVSGLYMFSLDFQHFIAGINFVWIYLGSHFCFYFLAFLRQKKPPFKIFEPQKGEEIEFFGVLPEQFCGTMLT